MQLQCISYDVPVRLTSTGVELNISRHQARSSDLMMIRCLPVHEATVMPVHARFCRRSLLRGHAARCRP